MADKGRGSFSYRCFGLRLTFTVPSTMQMDKDLQGEPDLT